MTVFCHVKKGDKVMICSGKFRKTIGNITVVCRISVNRFAVAIDSIPKISKKKEGRSHFLKQKSEKFG